MGLLAQPQPMQDRRRRHQPQGRLAGSGVTVELSPPGREHQRLHRRMTAHPKGNGFSPIEKLRQPGTELIERQGDVGPIPLHSPLGAPAEACPHLRRRILGVDKQHKALTFRTMGQQQGHRIRFIETCEVEKIAVLAERPLAVRVMGGQWRRRDHGSGRTELIEEALPPARVDAGVDVVHAGVRLS